MTYKTHIQAGFITGAIVNYINPIQQPLIGLNYIIICGLASTLPDLDSPTSFASNALYGLDDILRKLKILKHRGISHFNFKFSIKKIIPRKNSMYKKIIELINKFIESKILTALIRYIVCFKLIEFALYQQFFVKALTIGYCSHILLDYSMSYLHIKTGSDIENNYVYNILGIGSLIGFISIVERMIN